MSEAMKEYEVTVTEKMISTVVVEAKSKDEAYEEAMRMLSEDFCAPYHDVIDVVDYTVEEI